MFVDRVVLHLLAGKGGNGVIAWRKEKYIPKDKHVMINALLQTQQFNQLTIVDKSMVHLTSLYEFLQTLK